MKVKQGILAAAVCAFLVLAMAGCQIFSKQAEVVVNNNTSGYVTAVVSVDGQDPVTLEVDGASGSHIVYFGIFERELSAEISVIGEFKREQLITAILVPGEPEIVTVEPECGALTFQLYSDSVSGVWLTPDDPVTYTTAEAVIDNAVYALENVGQEGQPPYQINPGTYYVVCLDADGYTFVPDPVVIALDEFSNVALPGQAIHPAIAPWLGSWTINRVVLYYTDSPPTTTNNTVNQTIRFDQTGQWEGSGTAQWESQPVQQMEIAADYEVSKASGTITFTYTLLIIDGTPGTPPPQATYDYAIDLVALPPTLTLTATVVEPYSPAEPLVYLRQ